MITPNDIIGAFATLHDLGVTTPAHLASGDEKTITSTARAYARLLNVDNVTPDELTSAVDGYVCRPLAHGGRRPWPDAGALRDVVMDARVAARPTYGAIADQVRRVISRHYSDRSKGWDTSGLPPAVASIVVEALVAARVSHRGDEPAQFVQRDVEREYEARRVRR